jgi:hypothetical protein
MRADHPKEGIFHMTKLHIGERVRISGMLPGFHLKHGTVTAIVTPRSAQASTDDAFRELRLYSVRLDDGRRFRFRGRELQLVCR